MSFHVLYFGSSLSLALDIWCLVQGLQKTEMMTYLTEALIYGDAYNPMTTQSSQVKTLAANSTHRHMSTEDCYIEKELPKGSQNTLVLCSDNCLL